MEPRAASAPGPSIELDALALASQVLGLAAYTAMPNSTISVSHGTFMNQGLLLVLLYRN